MAAQPGKTPATQAAHPATSGAIMEAFQQLVYMVPEAPEDDGSSIVLAVLEATSWEDVNQEDGLPSSKTLAGRSIKVEKISRKVSDQDSATGYYLLCDGVDGETKKSIRFTAGGAQAVAVLAKAHVMNWLPVVVRFDLVKTKSGNDAVNCRITAAGGPGAGS